MAENETRKLVKVLLDPDVRDALGEFAVRTHRPVGRAAEHLIAVGLRAETPPQSDLHLR